VIDSVEEGGAGAASGTAPIGRAMASREVPGLGARRGIRVEEQHPLSLEEHRELGIEMKQTTARLRELCDLVVGVYGTKSRAGFAFQTVITSLERLHQELELQAVADSKGYAEKLYS